jgi:hypothetical protein
MFARIGIGRVITLVTVVTLTSFCPSMGQADQYRDGRFSFDIAGVPSGDVASAVLGNLLLQGMAEDVKPIVARWPNVPCYRAISPGNESLRQLSDVLGGLKNRLGLSIAACTNSSSSAIAYYLVRGHISNDEKQDILDLVPQVPEDNKYLAEFLHEQTRCYWHAHIQNVGGLLDITNAAVLVNVQSMAADQITRCLFLGTAGSLGLTRVVPAHDESARVNWGPVAETDLLSLFVLYNFKDEVVAGDSRVLTTATEAIVSAIHEMGR